MFIKFMCTGIKNNVEWEKYNLLVVGCGWSGTLQATKLKENHMLVYSEQSHKAYEVGNWLWSHIYKQN